MEHLGKLGGVMKVLGAAAKDNDGAISVPLRRHDQVGGSSYRERLHQPQPQCCLGRVPVSPCHIPAPPRAR